MYIAALKKPYKAAHKVRKPKTHNGALCKNMYICLKPRIIENKTILHFIDIFILLCNKNAKISLIRSYNIINKILKSAAGSIPLKAAGYITALVE